MGKEKPVSPSRIREQGNGEPLICPVCEGHRLKVLATRSHKGTYRRRRKCLRCDFRFYTAEYICDIEGEIA